MGSNDEFGPDTESIRAWLAKRATYADDVRIVGTPRGSVAAPEPPSEPSPEPSPEPPPEPSAAAPADPSPPAPSARSEDMTSDHGAAAQTPTAVRPRHAAGPRHAAPRPAAGPDSVDAGRSVLAALGVEAPATPAAEPPPAGADAAKAVLDALHADPVAQPTDRPRPAAAPRTAPETAHSTWQPRPRPTPPAAAPPVARPADVPPATVQVGRWTEPVDNLTAQQATTDADFPPRSGVRRALSLILLLALAATAGASYLAWEDRSVATIGMAVTLAVLTLVVWAARAGCTTTSLSIRRGQLTVRRGGQTDVVDLASQHTPIAIVGEPGQRRWRVLVERHGLPLVVISPGMVDPHWFTTALYRVRPDLRPAAQRPVADEETDATESQDADAVSPAR
ncbi:hypothetical protein [Nocardioides sp. SYSU DS0651]|uniref:hypothetical protein n=1 Tax=Nocardioides sp. SYSU DS0651 TaxID=3415955 RepID=UPI003F4BA57E